MSLAFAMTSGGLGVPGVHYLVYGETDPFSHGWPLLLEASSLLSAFVIALWLRCFSTAALGIYVGLLGFMYGSGSADYPMSSAVGLAVHGFLPAAFASALAFGFVCWNGSKVAHEKPLKSYETDRTEERTNP